MSEKYYGKKQQQKNKDLMQLRLFKINYYVDY